jgi:hypothetical protein
MQVIERRRAYANSVRRRRFTVTRGWPQFFVGLGIFLLGAAVTAYTFIQAGNGGGPRFFVLGIIAGGVVQMIRGLASLSAVKEAQAPPSQQQAWLFARAAFGPDGTAAAPGWFTDPTGSGGLRFWDGQNWTEQTRPAPPGWTG